MKKQITLLFIFCSLFSSAQSPLETVRGPITEIRKTNPKIPWNNHAYFQERKPTKALNWSDYLDSWDKKQWVIWSTYAWAGAMWGMREAYHADPYCFEKKWDVGSGSWFGSDAWKRNYRNNDPTQPHKHEWMGNVGRDVHHTFGFGSKVFLAAGTFTIGTRKQPIKYRVANMLIGWGIHSLFATAAYQALR